MTPLDMHELKYIIETAMDRELPELDLDANLYEDLGMDSIGAVAMVVEIQRQSRIRIPEEDIPRLLTARQLLDYINNLAAETSAG